jgi:type I restriction enzyme S subunit
MKQVPAIRFEDFTDVWEQRELGDLAVEVKRKADKDSDAPVMMISASEGFIDQSQRYSNNNAGSSLKNYTLLYEGELAYNHGYSKFRNFGSVFDLKVEKARIPFVYHSFALPEDDHRFFAYYLNSGLFDGELKKLVSSTARMDGLLNISYEDYMSIPVLRPPVQEQEKIGRFLTNLDTLITLHQRKCDKLLKFKTAMLEKFFPKKSADKPDIRFEDYTDAWEQRKFSDFTFPAGERNKDDLDLEPFAITNNQGFIAQSEAHDDFGYMKDVDRKMYIVVKPNSFAYNPARINIGSLGYYEGAENVIVSSLYEVFQTAEYVDDKFLKHWFKTKAFQDWIERLQEGSVRLYFYYDKLCECIMSMPSVEEQRKIGAYLDKIDSLITLHQRKLEKLKQFEAAMLEKMFV